jgi:cytochrome c-type biogenesis protein
MSELSFLALAFGLGLLGFIEPCSIGANGIFLGYLQTKERSTRLFEILKFSLGRSAVLGLFGLSITFVGSFIFSAQKGFWLFLGLLYLALGIIVILNARFRWGLFSRLSMGRLMPDQKSHSVGLGLLFGLNLPACAYPLVVALLGRSALSGAAWGFATLFVFGLALSLPLIPLTLSRHTEKILAHLSRFGSVAPYVIGLALLAISAYILYTATPYFDLGG